MPHGPAPDLLTVCSEFGHLQFFIARPLLLAFTDVYAERRVGIRNRLAQDMGLGRISFACFIVSWTIQNLRPPVVDTTRLATLGRAFFPTPPLEPPAERERPRSVPGPIVSRIDGRVISRLDQTAILLFLHVNIVCFGLVSPSHYRGHSTGSVSPPI